MIIPVREDHIIYQGVTWERTFQVLQNDKKTIEPLVGCTARLVAKEDVGNLVKVLDVVGVVFELAGQVKFTVNIAATDVAGWKKSSYEARLTWPGSTKIDIMAYGTYVLKKKIA